MWILESPGEFLQGKRVWLRPGQRYLFGRVKKDGVVRCLDHKGVSRRQCVIEVGNVTPGDGSLLHTRSKITVTDEGSKGGTQVDGHRLKGTGQELTELEHELRLGTYPHVLTIRWLPICLSFFLTSKEKKSPDPLGPKRNILEPLDVKTVHTFVPTQTTHVVATKRNTVPGLQALITGRYIVDHSYIDALVFASTPEDLEGDENLTPLEKDFDAAWPDPHQHIPPRGREPTSRPAEAYGPDSSRETIFQGWTFVFLESAQYETILPAINTGHGKGLLYNLKLGKTTVQEVVTFTQNAAGGKSFQDRDQSASSGGVIIVKPTVKGEFTDWGERLLNGVASQMNQQCIDQADFLDPILASNATLLRKVMDTKCSDKDIPCAPASATSAKDKLRRSLAPETHATSPDTDNQVDGTRDKRKQVQSNPTEPDPPRKRPRARGAPASRFKAFDDEFDLYAVTPYEPVEEENGFHDINTDDIMNTPTSLNSDQYQKARNPSLARSEHSSSREDIAIEQLLPAAAALKRRRPELTVKAGTGAEQNSDSGKGEGSKRKTGTKKEIDIRKIARERREAEEEAGRRDKEVLESRFGDIRVEDMKDVAVVEDMEVPARKERADGMTENPSERWEERWNGRKNFKSFRRRGSTNGATRVRREKTMVPLVEVKRKNYGIGEAYWSSSHEKEPGVTDNSGGAMNDSLDTETTIQPQIASFTEDTPPVSAMTRPQQEAADVIGAIEARGPRRIRFDDETQQESQQTTDSHNQRGKRPAGFSAVGRATAKRQKTLPTKATSEGESDEDLRFEFRSRKN